MYLYNFDSFSGWNEESRMISGFLTPFGIRVETFKRHSPCHNLSKGDIMNVSLKRIFWSAMVGFFLLFAIAIGRAHAGGYGHGSYHSGPSFGRIILGTAVAVGGVVALNALLPQSTYAVPVYVVPIYQQPCQYVRQQVFDQYRRPLFDQYGQPITQTVYTCSGVQYAPY